MSMELDPDTYRLLFLSDKITFYCPIIIITMGNIGCFCNFITFTSIKLRKTSCSLYFLAAAIFDLLTLNFGTLTRLLADHFGYILYNQSRAYCKIRQYLVTVLPAIATCFIVLATMDRYMFTSSKLTYRSFATMKRAKWIVSLSLTICSLSYLHYMIFAELTTTCSLQSGAYSLFTVVYSIVWTSIIPHFLMLCFGFGTQWHIRTLYRRVLPLNVQQRRIRRTEIQLVSVSQSLYFVSRHLFVCCL
jgi:hypothetical protein